MGVGNVHLLKNDLGILIFEMHSYNVKKKDNFA